MKKEFKIRKNKKCLKCKKPLDRKGHLCRQCYLEGIVRSVELSKRTNDQRHRDLKEIEASLYKKIFKKVIKELDKKDGKDN